MALVFWGLSSSTHLDAAPAWQIQVDLPKPLAQSGKSTFAESAIQVLSFNDAVLYRAAFAAQAKADWDFADKAMAQATDKRLVGHVLADRYLRRNISLDEAKTWLSVYADLPEAEAIYSKAKALRGFSTAQIEKPEKFSESQGNYGYSSPSAFRSTTDSDEAAPKGSLLAEVNAALRGGDPVKARDVLFNALNRGQLPITKAGAYTSRIAAAFYFKDDIDNARKMAHLSTQLGIPLGLWIKGLAAWKQHDFGTSAFSFGELAQKEELSPWNQAAAAYWAYRAHSRLGDKTEAHKWLALAAKSPRSFYGALAMRQLGAQPERSWDMPELSDKSIALLSAHPSGWQALALVQAGRNDLAEESLKRVLPGSREMQRAALALAEYAQLPSVTLQLGSFTPGENGKPFDAALYPLPPWQPASGFQVDRALIYAIMRHESQFDQAAVSPRGACGLMQIMPATARRIANDFFQGTRCSAKLLDPQTNIDMGQKYVRILSETPMIGNNLLFLLAAYNGGPGNLAHWLSSDDRNDPLLFIESLPVRETREYVQQVLLHYWMYRSRLSKPDTAVAALARGEWPRYAVSEEGAKRVEAKPFEFASLESGVQ